MKYVYYKIMYADDLAIVVFCSREQTGIARSVGGVEGGV